MRDDNDWPEEWEIERQDCLGIGHASTLPGRKKRAKPLRIGFVIFPTKRAAPKARKPKRQIRRRKP